MALINAMLTYASGRRKQEDPVSMVFKNFPFSWERAFINSIDLIGKNTNLELQACMLITESKYLKDNIVPHELLIIWHYEPSKKDGSKERFLKLTSYLYSIREVKTKYH